MTPHQLVRIAYFNGRSHATLGIDPTPESYPTGPDRDAYQLGYNEIQTTS
jgi:hypothetical protein